MNHLNSILLRAALVSLPLLCATSLIAQPSWRTFGTLISPRSFHNALYIGGNKILVMGGLLHLGGHPVATADCEVIDVHSGTVSPAAAMNEPRAEFVALLTPQSNVIVVSGLSGVNQRGTLTPTVELYDRASGTWRVLGSLRTARRQHVAGFLNEREILVVGGRHQYHETMADAEIFDITTGTSRPAASFPFIINSASMGRAGNGDLVVLGGREGGANSERKKSVYRYDVTNNKWEISGMLATPMQGTNLLKLWDGRLMVSGGAFREDPLDFSDQVQVETAGTWQVVGQMHTERQWSSSAQWSGDSVLTVGGFDNDYLMLRSTDWVNLHTGTITPGPELIEPRSYFATVAVQTCFGEDDGYRGAAILVIGGRTTPDIATGSIEILEQTCGPITSVSESDRSMELQSGSFGRIVSNPNPFDRSTEIRFDIPADGWTTLTIVDVTGNRVARLVDGPLIEGRHRISWDATHLEAGIYFCRLTSGLRSETSTLVVVR